MAIYEEVVLDAPTVLHPTADATAQSLFPNYPHKYVYGFTCRVRSMGTATYIRFGNSTAQELTLDAVGETFTWKGNAGQVMDLAKVFVLADQDDCEIEILAEYVPMIGSRQVVLTQSRSK